MIIDIYPALVYLYNLFRWENFRGLELISQTISSIGIVFIYLQYKRQRLIDITAISITPISTTGEFEVTNNGDQILNIELSKSILNDGLNENDTEGNLDKIDYINVFIGKILPKQKIYFHSFDIGEAEKCFIFKGIFRLKIQNKNMILVKVKFAGDLANKSTKLRNKSHPHNKWVIYNQEIE